MPASGGRKPATKKTAARSGNPAKRDAPTEASSAASFKKGRTGNLVELPSGNAVRMTRPGLTGLIADGLLSDSFSRIAAEQIDRAKGGEQLDPEAEQQKMIAEMLRDPQKLADLMASFDKVVVRTWTEPKVAAAVYPAGHDRAGEPLDPVDRNDNQLYTDEIEFDDKAFTFQYVSGGDSDIDRFREATGAAVENVSAGE